MFKNSFSSYPYQKTRKPMTALMRRRKEARIYTCASTEFIFCNRRFGAVILDSSGSGMKLSCDIKLGVGSIIQLITPSVSGKIVWRDDKQNLIGITFIKASPGQSEWF